VVLLADILPTFFIKTTAPLYLMRFSYLVRVALAIAAALLSFLFVAFAQNLGMALMGVVFASISSGLGEVTFLSMSSLYHKVNGLEVGTKGCQWDPELWHTIDPELWHTIRNEKQTL
jgi:predicted membrane channel-forming protein YqfA (hemolysin III family)